MTKTIRQRILALLPERFRFTLRYMAAHKRFSLLLWPTTFTEKNMLRIAKDRRSLLKTCADKLAMRRYVEQKVGAEFLPKVYCVTDDPRNINWRELPERFVIKASHGSGFVSVVTNFNPSDTLRIEKMVNICLDWLKVDYGRSSREWAYVNLPRNILIEEFIESNHRGEDGVPWDFKCFVFDGRCAMIQVDTGRFLDHRMNLYSPSWDLFDCTYIGLYPQNKNPLERPAELGEIIELAEKIGAGIDFVRVDIYTVKTKPLIGELTMTPGGGIEVKFTNPKLDRFLGKEWKMAPFHD